VFKLFNRKIKSNPTIANRLPEFNYLKDSNIYMDSACQSLRPQPVIDAMTDYYQTYGACGSRVKYKWGQKVSFEVEETRDIVIDYLALPKKDYVCSFTLNTTFGINLILSQLPAGIYQQVITSEIEHNSVFLPTIELAKRLNIPRTVLSRADDGSLIYTTADISKAIVVVNATSNIDGRLLLNIKQLVKDVHDNGGIVIIDAAQTMAHSSSILASCMADAICFSAHKLYAASLGVIVIKKSLLSSLIITFIGGGMVTSVSHDNYNLLPDDMSSWLEPGLQAYAEIISLKRAIEWLGTLKVQGKKPTEYIAKLAGQLFEGLSDIPDIKLLNKSPSSVISCYSPKIDAHRLAIFLSESGIMVRSGYFCCHYYLLETLKLPPLLRFSIGLHTTEDDIAKTLETLKKYL
jgi:cysteine desulfurase/selenocysteine lyase